MKRETWLRPLLTLNAILLSVVVVLLAYPIGRKTPPSGGTAQPERPRTASAARAPHEPKSAEVVSAGEGSIQGWMPQLRSIGIPTPLLARLAAGDFEVRWEARRHELQRRCDRGEVDDTALGRFESQHDHERDSELRAVLGDEAFRQWDREDVVRRIVPDELKLSAAETDAVYQLKKSLVERRNAVTAYVQNGEIDQMECDQMQADAQSDYQRGLQAVLGDERYATLQGADMKAEAILRRDLLSLNATDAQLTTVLATQRQWNQTQAELDRQLQAGGITDVAYRAKIQAADVARDDEYRRALGPNGFDDLQKVQNTQYQTLKRYATAWELSDGDVDYLYRSLQTYQKNLADIQSRAQAMAQQGQPIDGLAMRQNLQQVSQQTLDGLRSYLGNERFNKLVQNDAFALGDSLQ
jgi:hypothetical protein